MDLYSCIKKVQAKDMTATYELTLCFEHIIRSYARKLEYPEAATDLNIFLILLARKINLDKYSDSLYLEKVIVRSLSNHKHDLFRKYVLSQPTFAEFDTSILEDNSPSFSNIESDLFIGKLLTPLTGKQREIIVLKYVKGFNDAEIAKQLGISRQSVTKTKALALKTLKAELLNKDKHLERR